MWDWQKRHKALQWCLLAVKQCCMWKVKGHWLMSYLLNHWGNLVLLFGNISFDWMTLWAGWIGYHLMLCSTAVLYVHTHRHTQCMVKPAIWNNGWLSLRLSFFHCEVYVTVYSVWCTDPESLKPTSLPFPHFHILKYYQTFYLIIWCCENTHCCITG